MLIATPLTQRNSRSHRDPQSQTPRPTPFVTAVGFVV
jgi:hypothetical protein